MAYNELPKVDDKAILSQKSVNAVENIFTLENKFISRKETPDYGVDIDIELIDENSNATSKKFPIQIKSSNELKTIIYNEIEYVSLQFKTSRLGYLCKRPPAYGIIIAYDELSDTCYAEYVESIVGLLDIHPNRKNWKENETVNILIPKIPLTNSNVHLIYEKMIARHSNLDRMISSYGIKYNIPNLNSLTPNILPNLNNSEEVAKFLITYWPTLFNDGKLNLLVTLINRIEKKDFADPNLFLMSALVFSQTGDVIEAEYYLRRLKAVEDELSFNDKTMIEFSKIRCEFLKGDISLSDYAKKLKTIDMSRMGMVNELIIDINLIHFQLSNQIIESSLNENLLVDINNIFEKILKVESTEMHISILNLFNAENLCLYALNAMRFGIKRIKLKEAINIRVSLTEKMQLVVNLTDLFKRATDISRNVYMTALESNSPLKTHSGYYLAKFFKDLQFQMMTSKTMSPHDEIIERYETYYKLGHNVFIEFMDLNLFYNAHKTLVVLLELKAIFRNVYNKEVGLKSESDILLTLRGLEVKYDIKPYYELIDEAYKETNTLRQIDEKKFWAEISDEAIDAMVSELLIVKQLSPDRAVNIRGELNTFRTFHKECKNEKIELLGSYDHFDNPETCFKYPTSYILRHSELKLQTQASPDITILLEEFHTILNK